MPSLYIYGINVEIINTDNRRFLVKAKILESNITNPDIAKEKYKCSAILKHNRPDGIYLIFVDEIKDVEFKLMDGEDNEIQGTNS